MTELTEIARSLSADLRNSSFGPPVTHVYDPLDYAWAAHAAYLERFGRGSKQVVLLGMNPGPYGMAQTGVPFGEVAAVRDWMGISAPVGRPDPEHPARPITGFECPRSEVSGRRLWGWAADRFGTPERFFSRFFVLNHCPLVFMEATGRNRTPDKLPVAERTPLLERCDRALRAAVQALEPEWVVGVGAFAEQRARIACEGLGVAIGRVLHPSPASPKANRGWQAAVEAELVEQGIELESVG